MFGHPGAGGQYGYGDTQCQLGVAYTTNFLNISYDDLKNFIDERYLPLLSSTYDSIADIDGINRKFFATYGSFIKAKANGQ